MGDLYEYKPTPRWLCQCTDRRLPRSLLETAAVVIFLRSLCELPSAQLKLPTPPRKLSLNNCCCVGVVRSAVRCERCIPTGCDTERRKTLIGSECAGHAPVAAKGSIISSVPARVGILDFSENANGSWFVVLVLERTSGSLLVLGVVSGRVSVCWSPGLPGRCCFDAPLLSARAREARGERQ